MSNGWTAMIEITEEDRKKAKACARLRLVDVGKFGMVDHFGKDSLLSHYIGAIGEIGFAKYRGVEWKCTSGVGAVADVDGFEVRAFGPDARPYVKTKKNDTAEMIASMAVLAGGTHALVVGWIWRDDLKVLGTFSDPGRRGAPAWMLYDLSHLDRKFPPRTTE